VASDERNKSGQSWTVLSSNPYFCTPTRALALAECLVVHVVDKANRSFELGRITHYGLVANLPVIAGKFGIFFLNRCYVLSRKAADRSLRTPYASALLPERIGTH